MMISRLPLSAALAALFIGIVIVAAPPMSLSASATEPLRDVLIGKTAMTLPVPADNCVLTPEENNRDGELFTAVQRSIGTENQLITIFADCAELITWRSAKGFLVHHGQVQTMVKLQDKRLTMSRQTFAKDVCAYQTAPASANTGPGVLKKDNAWLEDRLRDLAVNQQLFIGTVDDDADACFTGLIRKIRTANETVRSEFAITATTLARGKVLYVYLYAPATNRGGLNALLTKAKRLVGDILKANGAK